MHVNKVTWKKQQQQLRPKHRKRYYLCTRFTNCTEKECETKAQTKKIAKGKRREKHMDSYKKWLTNTAGVFFNEKEKTKTIRCSKF